MDIVKTLSNLWESSGLANILTQWATVPVTFGIIGKFSMIPISVQAVASGSGLIILLLLMLGQQIQESAAYVAASLNGSSPVVALTFDDGPSKYWTEGLLDGLEERNVKATFFLIGANAEVNPELVERMAAEGHLIGNHTYSHVQLTTISNEAACAEIEEANAVLTAAAGEVIHYIRPPFGSWQKGLDSLVDMQVVLLIISLSMRDGHWLMSMTWLWFLLIIA